MPQNAAKICGTRKPVAAEACLTVVGRRRVRRRNFSFRTPHSNALRVGKPVTSVTLLSINNLIGYKWFLAIFGGIKKLISH